MTDDILLTEESFQVLKRLPVAWYDEREAVAAIAESMHVHEQTVSASIEHLRRRHLVERRTRPTGERIVEIRKIGR